jgi:hypothetical protein
MAFRHYPGQLAVAAALIRCDDWVPKVQAAAFALLDHMLSPSAGAAIFRYLELLERLRHRRRVSGELWSTKIRPLLLAPEARDERWSATQNVSVSTRKFAYEIVAEAEPQDVLHCLQRAVADPHPIMAAWALSQVPKIESADARRTVLKLALVHRYASIRRIALRDYCAEGGPAVKDTLHEMLFDPSRGPRRTAAFELDHLFQEPAIQFWREAIGNNHGRRVTTAILAICEFGQKSDAIVLARQAEHRFAIVRASVLRALWRLDVEDIEARLARALRDQSNSVVRTASNIYCRGVISLDEPTLTSALSGASDHTKAALMSAAHLLGKWEALAFLLRQCAEGTQFCASLAADQIERWVRHSNQRFTLPSSALTGELPRLLRTAQERNPVHDWSGVAEAIRDLWR